MSVLLVVHVVISLVGIAAGFVVVRGLWTGHRTDGLTAVFLVTTIATSVTGFPLPADRVLPSHVVGVLTLVALGVAIEARYRRRLAGGWRRAYVIASLLALYFNVFVGVVQAFLNVPALHALAPTQAEWPFLLTQVALVAAFVALGRGVLARFHPRAAA